ncbi:unnamed protein product [Dovyalis caffra]|uniref:Wall-associated receptor kinase C-terminal domain-containing protein n=1 Tax=Dovyalis caffra TaxID=77055 RepID=A0AAV1QZZ6_9ROSI|nr:unnamed protein product [Dovyalis caffra]
MATLLINHQSQHALPLTAVVMASQLATPFGTKANSLSIVDIQASISLAGVTPEFDWHRYCESVESALVSDEAIYGDLVQGFGQALQGGFKLNWKQPNGACQSCEASGGLCGYSNSLHNNFFCICNNRRHSMNCNKQGALITVGPEPNYIYAAIGALIFGGSVIAATVFYFTQKKKGGSYKPV